MKYTLDDMYESQNKFWSLEYQGFYRKTFEETVRLYPHDTQRVCKLQNRARKLLNKSPHYHFLKNHLFNFPAINVYGEEHYGWLDDEINGLEDNPPIELIYLFWFVTVCIEMGYGDDKYEFENDLLNAIGLIGEFKAGVLPDNIAKRLSRELLPWLAAYRIICDVKYKLAASIDVEFWYCEPEKHDPTNEWFFYYLPVNLDLGGGSHWPSWEVLMKAREKIYSSYKVLNREDV